jgi:hypothetical protein
MHVHTKHQGSQNAFLTRHGTYNINSNRKIVKSQVKFFN